MYPVCIPRTDAVPYTDNQPIETSNGEQAETNITSTRRRLLGVNVCEGSSLVLSCPPGLVVGSITTAFFGRSDTTSCPYPGAMQNTRCASPTLAVVNAVADKCVCFKSCTVSTSLSSLGLSDPCGGTYKWLSASGTCVGPNNKYPNWVANDYPYFRLPTGKDLWTPADGCNHMGWAQYQPELNPVCNAHDACYWCAGSPGWGLNKQVCDDMLYYQGHRVCDIKFDGFWGSWNRWWCGRTVDTMYGILSVLGNQPANKNCAMNSLGATPKILI